MADVTTGAPVQTVGGGDGDARNERKVRKRPRAGLILVCLSGLLILWIPANLYWLAFVPGSFAFAGLLFGTLVLACGVLGWFMPRYVRLLGALAMIISIVSVIGALGGMILGTLLGIIGGALCIAWSPKEMAASGESDVPPGGGPDIRERDVWSVSPAPDSAWSRWYR
ncbi:MAG: hypothetical protein IRY98_11080 [Alicyclobacillaceae bacterium]|nr:hypothetical protein [Alicyclobacillaceae bacterium]